GSEEVGCDLRGNRRPRGVTAKEEGMTTVRHGIVCMAAGFMMLSLTGGRADAQTVKRGVAQRISSVQGVDTYKAYCATCHGPLAKGDGPAATALKKVPADLTTIA